MRALSMARTWKVCDPPAKPVYFLGEVQLPKGAPSMEHSKVDPASEEEKLNVALFCFVAPEGPESMVVSGGMVSCGGGGTSTVKVLEAELASTLPALSFALTSKVCGPLGRFE